MAVVEDFEILRCPRTHQPLHWSSNEAAATGDNASYPFTDGVGRFLQLADRPHGKDPINEFYSGEGWEADDAGVFCDTQAFVDTRPVPANYTHKCMVRLNKHFAKGGDYLLDAGSGPVAQKEVLDYGEHFRKRVCIDLSAPALKVAARKLGDKGICLQGDLTNIPLVDNSMDAITCNHVIYQLPKDLQAKAFLELYRVLKPGGVAVVVYWWADTPLAWKVERLTRIFFRKQAAPEPASLGVKLPDLTHEPQSLSWFQSQSWPFRYEFEPFRIVTNAYMRRYIPDDWRGSLVLNSLYGLQQAMPRYCGKYGTMPVILMYKDAPSASK